jgi:hypothetical protein
VVRLLHHTRKDELRRLLGFADGQGAPVVPPGEDEDEGEDDDVPQRAFLLHGLVDLQGGLGGGWLRGGGVHGGMGCRESGAPEGRRGVVARGEGEVCVRCRGAVHREQGLFGGRNAGRCCEASPACGFDVEYSTMGHPFIRLCFGGENVGMVSTASPPGSQQDIQGLHGRWAYLGENPIPLDFIRKSFTGICTPATPTTG